MDNQKVEVGHFASQGTHSDSSLTYPELMAIQHFGLGGQRPRMIRTLLKLSERRMSDVRYNTLMKSWGKSNYSQTANQKLLEGFGIVLAKKEKALFGKPQGVLMPPNSPNTKKKVGIMGPFSPLVDTGELRSKVSYKTSIGKTLKGG
jgi:hypothetical protein